MLSPNLSVFCLTIPAPAAGKMEAPYCVPHVLMSRTVRLSDSSFFPCYTSILWSLVWTFRILLRIRLQNKTDQNAKKEQLTKAHDNAAHLPLLCRRVLSKTISLQSVDSFKSEICTSCRVLMIVLKTIQSPAVDRTCTNNRTLVWNRSYKQRCTVSLTLFQWYCHFSCLCFLCQMFPGEECRRGLSSCVNVTAWSCYFPLSSVTGLSLLFGFFTACMQSNRCLPMCYAAVTVVTAPSQPAPLMRQCVIVPTSSPDNGTLSHSLVSTESCHSILLLIAQTPNCQDF